MKKALKNWEIFNEIHRIHMEFFINAIQVFKVKRKMVS